MDTEDNVLLSVLDQVDELYDPDRSDTHSGLLPPLPSDRDVGSRPAQQSIYFSEATTTAFPTAIHIRPA
jgi:hypothetical protein